MFNYIIYLYQKKNKNDYSFLFYLFSQIFLTNRSDKVDNVNPITGTRELKNILSIFLITYEYAITTK